MFFKALRDDLAPARTEASQVLSDHGGVEKNFTWDNFTSFFSRLGVAAGLVVKDPEILLFAALQWIVVGAAYVLWTKALDWIPDELWREVGGGHDSPLVNLFLLGWSIAVIAVASYPISIFSAAIVAARNLRNSDENSTIFSCLDLATRHIGRLWAFTFVDAVITVNMILERLPKRKAQNVMVAAELLYYAWKIGTIGVLPALVNGRDVITAGKESIQVLRNNPLEAIGTRMGYSLFCWIVGISAYVGAMLYFIAFGSREHGANEIYNFYVLMALPIFVAVGVVTVLLRPIYLLMIAELYIYGRGKAPEPLEQQVVPPTVKPNLLSWHLILFLLGATGLVAAYFFGDQLHIREWVQHLSDQDLLEYRQQGGR